MSRGTIGILLALLWPLSGEVRAQVVINEIMYNSPQANDVEYVELINAGAAPQDLAGWTLIDDDDGHPPCVLQGILDPGEILVVAGDLALFQTIYPTVTNVNPNPFGPGFGLANSTDQVRLFDDEDDLVDSVTYTDAAPWPTSPDGGGPSLELENPALDNALAQNWAASTGSGTPGAQNSAFVSDVPPVIELVNREPPLPVAGQPVTVTVRVTDTDGLSAVELFVDTGAGFSPSFMLDDGLHGDGAAADDRYGTTIGGQPGGTLVRYYVRATDTSAQESFSPTGAPANYLAYTVGHTLPALVINEILASNQAGVADEALDRDDWLEIRNAGPHPVALGGMFLSEDPSQTRMWPIPATTLQPGARLHVWCDDELEGPFHANFRLGAEGGFVGLFETIHHGNVLVHAMTFGVQSADRSFGYRPEDADAPEYLTTPTPAASNGSSTLLSSICINEFLTSSTVGVPDWIELYNRGGSTMDISTWSLADAADQPVGYTFPPGTLIPSGGFLSVDADDLGFGLDNNGSEILMLTRLGGSIGMDYFDYGPQNTDVSQGRFPDGTPNWQFFGTESRDLPNSCDQGVPPLDPVVHVLFSSRLAFSWDPLPGATGYDVVQGDLELLRGSSGNYAAAGISCLENNGQDTEGFSPTTPPPNEAFFYLVRGTADTCAFGTYDSSSDAQQNSRDPEIATAGGSCF